MVNNFPLRRLGVVLSLQQAKILHRLFGCFHLKFVFFDIELLISSIFVQVAVSGRDSLSFAD